MKHIHAVNWAAVLVLLSAIPTITNAQEAEWKPHAKRCMQAFSNFEAVTKEELTECTVLWESYRSPATIKASERHVATQAFRFLCKAGSDQQAFVAESALLRMGDRPCERSTATRPGEPQPPIRTDPVVNEARPTRQKYNPEPASEGDAKKARAMNDKGYDLAKKKKRDEALRYFEKAIELNPRYEQAIYFAAAQYAQTDRVATAIDYLGRLRDLGTETAGNRLQEARMEPDFEPARDNSTFKNLTGYAKIKLINSRGEVGEDEVDRIAKYFEKAKFPIHDTGHDKHERDMPIIWTQDGTARSTAFILMRLVNHPNTQVVMIDWDTDYDIIVSWGDTYKKNARGDDVPTRTYEVKDPEKTSDEALREQDRALREPDKYASEVDNKLGTPERMMNRGESSINRVERSVDTIENLGKKVDKIQNLGK